MIDWVVTTRLAGAIAGAIGLVLLLGTWAAIVSLRRLRLTLQTEADRAHAGLRELGAEFSQLASANLALREYLVSLSERVEQSRPLATTDATAAHGRAYELAARLAAGGSTSNDLVANCGLTRTEADLAVLVHGSRARAAH